MPLTDAPKIVTRRLHEPRSWTLESYLADSGYQGLRKALTMTPQEIHDSVNTAAAPDGRVASPAAAPGPGTNLDLSTRRTTTATNVVDAAHLEGK